VTGVSGLGEVPSTVEILAEGLPDGVMQIARKKAKEAEEAGREISPEKVIEEAEKEYKNFIALAEKKAAEIRAKLQIQVEYDTRTVGSGEGGALNKQGFKKGGATPGQVDYLEKLGVKRETAEGFSRGQAGVVIEKRKALQGAAYRITFGKYAGKALGEIPESYVSMMSWQNEQNGKFPEVAPQIERMYAESEAAWRDEFDGAFREPSPEPQYHAPQDDGFRHPTEAHKRLAAKFGFPEPRSFSEGVEIVNQINGAKR
jgi:uncharacterized protein (DUF3820 family)